jgi:pilus assembly protein Flp/PilA
MLKVIKDFLPIRADRRGVTALEYGLIAGLISVVIVAAVGGLATNLSAKFLAIANTL